jgi:hypothetical protein
MRENGRAGRSRATRTCPLCLAELAAFGVVLELLIVEKQLFSGSKHKLIVAVGACQEPINKLHCALSHSYGIRMNVNRALFSFLSSRCCVQAWSFETIGPDPT